MLTDRPRTPASILAEWREAERALEGCDAESPEYDDLAARVLELARTYREASDDLEHADERPSSQLAGRPATAD